MKFKAGDKEPVEVGDEVMLNPSVCSEKYVILKKV